MNDAVLALLRCYPQIYLACHVEHVRARSNAHALSARDASLLSHLDRDRGIHAAELAQHMQIRPSTLSAALTRLEKLGYVERETDAHDRRVHRLRLSARGEIAMAESSVLDPQRAAALLARLAPTEREHALEGLALLARAARELAKETP
ncbi:MarR family transcriptional regulator [Dokdonella sp.]|uniref:MarR family winged helix-turn-helix transcriptional regulator n=1 Tax=Dokdonella sp. TaxID=2291710 RepID=UPI001B0B7DD8|nr:MarR family transcriptional regulator [Dokdonella sp.]MBO9662329.1 MarR family transcriptional regulator [Dokdonella sp.]